VRPDANQIGGLIRLYGNEATKFRGKKQNSPLFEIARVLVRFDHVARFIVNANYGIM
jgi:hypothetical protein